jgi:hypothetical protein
MTARTRQLAKNAYVLASIGAILLFLLIIAAAALIYALDIPKGHTTHYKRLLREDGQVEQFRLGGHVRADRGVQSATGAALGAPLPHLVRGFLGAHGARGDQRGQRAFKLEPGAFFQEHSDQEEINVHNVVQQYLKRHRYPITKTRQFAAIVLVAYGVVLPILNAFQGPKAWFRRLRLAVPPPALIPGFLLGSLLAWFDWPTGREEEIGELLFSLCFALLVPLWRLQQRYEVHSLLSVTATTKGRTPGR